MAFLLRVMGTVLAIPRWFGRLFTSQKRSKDYIYLTVEEVIEFNVRVTNIQGQLRDRAGLESAIMRPQMASHYEQADIVTQAALLVDGICMTHAFNDGNKRTALIACTTFLDLNRYMLEEAEVQVSKEIEALVVNRDLEYFTEWLRKHIRCTFKPVRQGVSPQVLEIADRMIQKYKVDLEYLKDR